MLRKIDVLRAVRPLRTGQPTAPTYRLPSVVPRQGWRSAREPMAWQSDWARDAWRKHPAHPRRGAWPRAWRGACSTERVYSSVLRHVDDGAGRPVKRYERDGPCERWRAPALASASGRLGSCTRLLLLVAAHVEKGVALEVVDPQENGVRRKRVASLSAGTQAPATGRKAFSRAG